MYVWGSNTEGQLGLGSEAAEAVYTPVLLNLLFKVRTTLQGEDPVYTPVLLNLPFKESAYTPVLLNLPF